MVVSEGYFPNWAVRSGCWRSGSCHARVHLSGNEEGRSFWNAKVARVARRSTPKPLKKQSKAQLCTTGSLYRGQSNDRRERHGSLETGTMILETIRRIMANSRRSSRRRQSSRPKRDIEHNSVGNLKFRPLARWYRCSASLWVELNSSSSQHPRS